MSYAEKTIVSVERTRAEIESVLAKYGASRFAYMISDNEAVIGFSAHGKAVKFVLPLPNRTDKAFTKRDRSYRGTYMRTPDEANILWEQACRTRWRALLLAIKAKLEAVQIGITSFEHEFLAHFVVPGGQTVGDLIIPQIEEASKSGAIPKLTLTS